MTAIHAAHASVPTAAAERYLGQLCKHFAHKIPVTYSAREQEGLAQFPGGCCRMEVEQDRLSLRCEAADGAALERIKGIVEDHLKRFAWRERLAVTWNAGP